MSSLAESLGGIEYHDVRCFILEWDGTKPGAERLTTDLGALCHAHHADLEYANLSGTMRERIPLIHLRVRLHDTTTDLSVTIGAGDPLLVTVKGDRMLDMVVGDEAFLRWIRAVPTYVVHTARAAIA